MARKSNGNGKQTEMPGVHDDVHKVPAVTRAAKSYLEARTAFQEAATTVGERKVTLIEVMKKHELESYHAAGLTVQLVHGKDGVKVRAAEDGLEEEAEA